MSHLQHVSIDKLKAGMFVEAVTKQTGHLKIKNQGLIKSNYIVDYLRRNGIQEVVVDVNRCVQLHANSKPAANDSEEGHTPQQNPDSPFEYVELALELKQASQLHNTAKHIQKRLFTAIEKDLEFNLNATINVVKAFMKSLDRNPNALLCMTQMKDKGGHLYEHSVNCGILMAAFARHMGISPQLVFDLCLAGMLHDLGMVKVPSDIINKNDNLTPKEQLLMQQHVKHTDDLLQPFKDLTSTTINACRSVHERLDGSGYPLKLSGDKVNLYGKMLAIVDSYNAMISNRSYKSPMMAANALKALLKQAKTKYDQNLVCQFIACIGVYPVGTLVKLKSEKIGVVTGITPKQPFRPKITTFYSTRSNHYLAKKDIDLAVSHAAEDIVSPTTPKAHRIDYDRFFKEQMQTA